MTIIAVHLPPIWMGNAAIGQAESNGGNGESVLLTAPAYVVTLR